MPGGDTIPYVIAYHEIIAAPDAGAYDPARCDVIYDGAISPDFYGWIFPHGAQASVGMGTGVDGHRPQGRDHARCAGPPGLEGCRTIRKEGAPIPLKPLDRWDNGRDVVLAGDAAGVVAPSSGEGIYYAMVGGTLRRRGGRRPASPRAAPATSGWRASASWPSTRRCSACSASMQDAYYKSDDRRERFVSLCHDVDVQRLTFEAYMNKRIVRARPMAHLRIMAKNIAHLTGLVRAEMT